MPRSSSLRISCPECERLEAEFLDARSRLQHLRRLRRLTPVEEKQLIDRVAMAIARIKEHERVHEREHESAQEKEHEATHSPKACEKGMAAG